MRVVRRLAWSVGILFLLGAVLQVVDALNLYTTPPDLPQSLNMVEFRLAVQDYRIAIWPIFMLGNLSYAIGFLALTALGLALAARLRSGDQLRIVIAASAITAGVLGAVGQLIIVGAAEPTIDMSYCDCGFKDTEIVSQIWAQMIAEGAAKWLVSAAGLLAAVSVGAVGTAFRDRMPPAWNLLSWLTAIGLVASVVLGFVPLDSELPLWLTAFVSGVIVPIWAVWLGASLQPDEDSQFEGG